MSRWCSLPVLVFFFFGGLGCGKKEETAESRAPVRVQKRETRIVVPPSVEGEWKAVKIAVLDKEKNREEVYTIDLGLTFPLPDSEITVQVQNFLPAFIMDGTTLTSVSNETKNPAVQVIIREGDEEIYKGWLFSLYPGAHAFQHPRYSFTLVDYLPAKRG